MRTISIENSTLDRLAADPAAVARLPHLLGNLAEVKASIADGSCGPCQAKQNSTLADAYSALKRALSQVGTADLMAVKELLGVDAYSVTFPHPKTGVPIRLER